MLQSIRDRTQGWIAGIVMSLLILSFAIWGIHSWIGGGIVNDTIAKVNGTEISKREVTFVYERLRHQLQSESPSNPLLQDDNALKQKALESLIHIQVLKQASVHQGYRISEAQLDTILESLPQFQVDGQFSANRFQQVLTSNLIAPAEFIETIKTTLLIDQPKMGVIFSSFLLPNEMDHAILLAGQQREIRYLLIPFKDFVKDVSIIPPQKIQAYYDIHKNDFKTQEEVSLDYLELSLNDLIKNINPGASELTQFYKENINLFTEPAKFKLETLLIPVPGDADEKTFSLLETKVKNIYEQAQIQKNFTFLAKQFNVLNNYVTQDWVTLKQLDPALQKALMRMQVGEISEPIKTAKGFVILKVNEAQKMRAVPFNEVSNKVRELYARQKAEEQFINLKEQLANFTYEHPENLKFAAQKLNLPIQSTPLFKKDTIIAGGILQNAQIRELAFSHEVLGLQNNSDVININPDKAVVFRIKNHVPEKLLSLDEVRQQIIQKLTEQEKISKAFVYSNSLMKQLQLNPNTPALAWNAAGYINRNDTKIDPVIVNTAFNMVKSATMQNAYTLAKLQDAFAIIELTHIKDGKVTDEKEYHILAEQFQQAQGLLEYELYKNSLMKKAKIVVY